MTILLVEDLSVLKMCPCGASVRSLAWHKDGEQLVSGDHSGAICVRSAATGEPLLELQCSGAVYSLAYSHDYVRPAPI